MTAPFDFSKTTFTITIEVVPPAGSDAEPLLAALEALAKLPIQGFSVATNPVAKPRMSALALCNLIQKRTGRPAILHCTTRDHNRLSLQGELWGAKALGIGTVPMTTGDFVALQEHNITTTVRDLDLFGLIALGRESNLQAGVVFDFRPESKGLDREVKRLERKVDAGAQFIVTQPVYNHTQVKMLVQALRHISLPIILGILPLRTPKHADFLHHKVAGIAVPDEIRERMHQAADPIAEGIQNAREVLTLAREHFAGACIMPPFDHFEVMAEILGAV